MSKEKAAGQQEERAVLAQPQPRRKPAGHAAGGQESALRSVRSDPHCGARVKAELKHRAPTEWGCQPVPGEESEDQPNRGERKP